MTESVADLSFTDQLALAAYDLRQVSLWLEWHRDRYEDAGLLPPYIGYGWEDAMRLVILCRNQAEYDAAVVLLADGGEVHEEEPYSTVRRFGTVAVQAHLSKVYRS